jgi:PIN domain nuclease of toxin-antitoxin system
VRLLLDTHALLWWLAGSRRLPTTARRAIGDDANAVYVSAASAWEIATKHRLGKLPLPGPLITKFAAQLADQGFTALDITIEHALHAGALPGPHRDPFDRMLIAQSLAEHLTVVSNEDAFDDYKISRLW